MKTIHNIEKKIDISALILILSVSAVIAYGYFSRVDRPNYEPRLELHNQIIAGLAPSPYRYRILVPILAEFFTKALSVVLPESSEKVTDFPPLEVEGNFFKDFILGLGL